MWCLSLIWLLVVSVDVHSAEYLYFVPLINLTDFFSILVFAGLLFIIYQHAFDQDKSLEWTFKITTILVGLLVFSSVVVRGFAPLLGNTAMECFNLDKRCSTAKFDVTLGYIGICFDYIL